MLARDGSTGRGVVIALLIAAALVVIALGGWAVVRLVRTPASGPGASASAPAPPQAVLEVLDTARALMDQDKAPAAEAILAPAAARFPESQQLHLLLGECLLQQGRLEEAYEHYARGIFIGPDHPEYRFAAGTVASQLGWLDEAEAHYLAAQSMQPSNPKFPLYLAQVQRKMGKVDEARANLLVATRLDETLAIAWATLAAIALDENRLSVAGQHIAKARALEPDRADFRVIEAKILRRNNDPERALDLLLAIPEEERLRDPGVMLELSLCFGLLGRTSEAASMYVSAVGVNPDDAEIAYQAAVWLERDRQPGRAASYARHAAAKGHEGARRMIERLERE